MAYGIGQQLDQLKGLSIQELMQRQSVDPQLVYALALQEKQKMEAAKERQAAMGMETSQGTEVEKMEADLASRRAPGVQMAAQRSMPQPQMAQGISANPTPNMQAIGRAQGGVVGYAQGGMPKVGEKSKGPIPQMSPEENAMALKYLEGLKKFDYYDKNPDKVSPEGRQALEQDRRTFEAQFPNSFRQKINEMMYGPSKGMAMGGDVKGYAAGDLVEEDEFAIVATGPNGEQYTADDVRLLTSQGAIVREADAPEPSDRIDNVMRRERLAAEADKEREKKKERELREIERQRRIEEDGPQQNPVAAALTALSEPLKPVGGAINKGLTAIAEDIIHEAKSYITDKAQQGITALQNRVAEQERQRAFNAEQAQADAIGMRPPTREQALRELLQPLMDNKQSVDNAMADITGADTGQTPSTVQTQGAGQPQGTTPPVQTPPKEGGIRSALSKTKPFLDKAMGIAEVLGRGAGASKGFEGAKIVEESRKIREAEADRAARLAEQRMMLEGRKAELDARNAAAMNMSAAEYAGQLTDDAIMMSDEYTALAEKLEDEAGFFMNAEEKESIRQKLETAIKTIRDRKITEYQGYLQGNFSGASGQKGAGGQGASEKIMDSAEFFSN